MKIKYNAPTTLTFAFFCTLVLALDQFYLHGLTRTFFTVPNAEGFDLTEPVNYLRLFTHIAGHADWNHLLGNMAYILLLGPILEETYGSLTMFLMIIVTGFVTGVLNACFFPHPLLGASGVVFMMILLASFTNNGKDEIPLTFILITILYLGREVLDAFKGDDISQFAHLVGGFCGSLFGFFKPSRISQTKQRKALAAQAARTAEIRPSTATESRPIQKPDSAPKPNASRTKTVKTGTVKTSAPKTSTPKSGESGSSIPRTSAPRSNAPKGNKTDATVNRSGTQTRSGGAPKKTTATMKLAASKKPRKAD